MKLWLLALFLLGVLLSAALAEQEEQARKRREVKTFQEADQEENEEEYAEEEVDVAKEEEKEEEKKKKKKKKVEDKENPCLQRTCRRGEICTVDKRQRARCVCIPECRDPVEEGDRYQVCSRRNVTYGSECELDRDHCLCRRQQEGCSNPKAGKIRLDYYGPCQELTPCTEREFGLFPGRMREWLYVVMQQMAQRAKIPDYLDMLEEARKEANHSHAVIWKFCDLDVDPYDRFVTRRELLFTIQSLKALEHCLLPFLDHCDTDSDGQITLWEWGRCLGLEEGKIRDECKNVRKAAGREKK
ncbi:SPARC-like isoform X2 [Babylonia areolata]|uniref:SPARC-like isoform X2 n=1 Tax=Babylonia areolata TaxID=304850 RepID=UPI003FD269A0